MNIEVTHSDSNEGMCNKPCPFGLTRGPNSIILVGTLSCSNCKFHNSRYGNIIDCIHPLPLSVINILEFL